MAGHANSVRIDPGSNVYHARVAPLRAADGRTIGCVGVQQHMAWLPDDDLTLRESDIRLQRIANSGLIGVAYGNDDGEITDANDAFLHMIGYTRDDLATDVISWPSLAPIDCHPRQLAAIDEVRRTGRCAPFETDLIRKDGACVTVVVTAARLSAQRREGVAVVLDVTERVREQRRLQAELAVADALLGDASPSAALEAALAAMCTQLSWRGAVIWQPDATPSARARHGAIEVSEAVLDGIARGALRTGEPMWSASARLLLVPLKSSAETAAFGLLILAAPPDRAPAFDGTAAIAAERAIAARLARFVNRSKT